MDLSSLDDIPEETILSGKSSEEKEIIRVDSGLGEWDSESSRKTSFSSQGRLSPDFPMEKTSKVRLVIAMVITPLSSSRSPLSQEGEGRLARMWQTTTNPGQRGEEAA